MSSLSGKYLVLYKIGLHKHFKTFWPWGHLVYIWEVIDWPMRYPFYFYTVKPVPTEQILYQLNIVSQRDFLKHEKWNKVTFKDVWFMPDFLFILSSVYTGFTVHITEQLILFLDFIVLSTSFAKGRVKIKVYLAFKLKCCAKSIPVNVLFWSNVILVLYWEQQ